MNPENARHLVESGFLRIRINVEVHMFDQILNVLSLYDGILKLCEARLAIEEENRHAKLHTELSLKSIRWTVMQKSAHHSAVTAHVDFLNLGRLHTVFAD